MNYRDAIDALYSLRRFSMKLGLDRTERLVALLGAPQRNLRFIHVAGTNGKGSTCAFLESIYRAAGLRVGLFTSPHLVHFGERIQVNRQPLSEPAIIALLERLQPILDTFAPDDHPTFFEVVTAMALLHFLDAQCDLVVWETGLGGRLDATNVVTPLASVITSIGLDHQKWLGDTIEQIAAEKAGIMKPGVPCLSARQTPEVGRVLRQAAAQQGSPFRELTSKDLDSDLWAEVSIPLPGQHQRENAALAVAVVDQLSPLLPVSPNRLRQGLTTTEWPGRFQCLQRATTTFILDGAHNPDGAKVLRQALEDRFPGQQLTFVVGVLSDKSWQPLLSTLLPSTSRLILVPVESERTANPAELEAFCRTQAPTLPVSCAASLKQALGLPDLGDRVVVAGSLYLVGQALELLQPHSAPAQSERGLNDWSPPGSTGSAAMRTPHLRSPI